MSSSEAKPEFLMEYEGSRIYRVNSNADNEAVPRLMLVRRIRNNREMRVNFNISDLPAFEEFRNENNVDDNEEEILRLAIDRGEFDHLIVQALEEARDKEAVRPPDDNKRNKVPWTEDLSEEDAKDAAFESASWELESSIKAYETIWRAAKIFFLTEKSDASRMTRLLIPTEAVTEVMNEIARRRMSRMTPPAETLYVYVDPDRKNYWHIMNGEPSVIAAGSFAEGGSRTVITWTNLSEDFTHLLVDHARRY